MHHRALPGLLLIALAAASTAAVAQERRYDVEIIVFENTDKIAGTQERWRPQVHVPEFHEVISFEGGRGNAVFITDEDRIEDADEDRETGDPEGYRPLPADRLQLGDMVEKLEDSDRYRVLRHLAWRQPADDRERALPIRVRAGEPIIVQIPIRNFEELYRHEEEAEESGADAGTGFDTDEAGTLAPDDDASGTGVTTGGARTFATGPMSRSRFRALTRPAEIHPLDGTVRVAVSRYLHVTTDLHLTSPVEWTTFSDRAARSDDDSGTDEQEAALDPAPTGELVRQQHPTGPDGRTMLSYPFQQSRRMRSSELHYLDHPVLGLLIRVERAPQDEEADSDAAD